MITSAIKIDDEHWAEWLDAVAATPKIRHIECDAALFSFSLDFLKSLDRHSLYGAHARDILPPETARFLNESPNDLAYNNLRKSIIHSMLSAENAGVSHFSLQMRLDEPFPDEENRIRKTAAFLRKLLLTPLEKPFKLDLQIRFPFQYPQSKEWERAIDTCNMAASKGTGPSLQLHSGHFDDTPPAPQEIVADILPLLHTVEFHYAPHLGESLFEDELAEWADLLKTNNFDGFVIFCPHLRPDENIYQHCMALQPCVDIFQEI